MSYNFLTLIFITILYYLEKNYQDKDYLIGFIVGLIILSKHTIGGMILIPLLIICFKNKKKLLKRIVGVAIPCILFLVYLLINNNLFEFINLCILGLFDFEDGNSHYSGIWFYLSIIIFVISIIFIIKNKNLKYNYYILVTFFFSYPLFDLYHFSLFLYFFLLMIFVYYKDYHKKYFYYLGIFLILILLIFYIYYASTFNFNYKNIIFKYYDTLIYPGNQNVDYGIQKKLLDKYCSKKDKCIIFDFLGTMYNTSRDYGLDYYSASLVGNTGYNGTQALIDKINKRNNVYLIFSKSEIENNDLYNQCNYKLFNYIKNNYKLIEEKYDIYIYYKK